ncbi:uncharacterized protein RCC_04796 [Ramularia collo-cygni]|uniref:NACHT domain-containing protein n=1 Tax=Ramularia collo-cygni TaxID=112498 RepID=A0A2D3US12_9PEZI|nr:uncharacterized protein RCC_04796 [Ramularia collo-cygni]CZT18951.1 uncharacterized protein RCC_04796 [Ramularia collo-cygni]
MADPLTALGAASAIVQFIDVASKLISTAHGDYNATSGATEQNVHLGSLTGDLQTFCKSLTVTYRDRAPVADITDQDTKSIIEMAERCRALATKLLKVLEDLKVHGTGVWRSFDAIRQAIRATAKSRHVASMQDALADIKGLLDSYLLKSIQTSQSSLQLSLDALARTTEAMHKENIAELRMSHSSIVTALARQERELSNFKSQIAAAGPIRQSSFGGSVLGGSSFGRSGFESIDNSIRAFTQAMERTKRRVDDVQKQLHILSSLQFPEMHMRHSAITEAHRSTFSWVYDETASTFATWLEGSDGLFWVNGKAGSGKSTFMKYVSDNMVDHAALRKQVHAVKEDPLARQMTRDGPTARLLRKWAGRKSLATASFYFWNSGFPLQKSQQGLMQSLLFQVMRKNPNLISESVPQRWSQDEIFHQHPDPWTRQELSEALTSLLSHTKQSTRFCFFIDGLDEYSGDHYKLVEDLKLLVDSHAVKICVSSRPWNAFTAAFAETADRALVLQDLTHNDVHNYVKEMLEDDARFKPLAQQDDRAHDLAVEIQEKAQGVFLWVFLVVRSLLRGLTDLDDIPMLQKRLRQLPTDLEQYFQLMLDSVDDVYQRYTARTLLIVFEADEPLSMLAFWYLESDLEDPTSVLTLPIKPLPDSTVKTCRGVVAARLKKWCRDLLEVVWSPASGSFGDMAQLFKVDFLHRTVRDFLMTRSIQESLLSRAGEDFCASLSTCRLYLALAKWLNPVRHEDGMVPFHRISGVILRSAASYEFRYGETPWRILNELERVGEHFGHDPWGGDGAITTTTRGDFLTLAQRYGLEIYLAHVAVRSSAKKQMEGHQAFSGAESQGLTPFSYKNQQNGVSSQASSTNLGNSSPSFDSILARTTDLEGGGDCCAGDILQPVGKVQGSTRKWSRRFKKMIRVKEMAVAL